MFLFIKSVHGLGSRAWIWKECQEPRCPGHVSWVSCKTQVTCHLSDGNNNKSLVCPSRLRCRLKDGPVLLLSSSLGARGPGRGQKGMGEVRGRTSPWDGLSPTSCGTVCCALQSNSPGTGLTCISLDPEQTPAGLRVLWPVAVEAAAPAPWTSPQGPGIWAPTAW